MPAVSSVRFLVLVAAAVAFCAVAGDRTSRAGQAPPQRLPVAAEVDVASRFGGQHFVLTGWLDVRAGEPRTEDGVSVFDLEVAAVDLQGASQLGVIFVDERPDAGEQYVSAGQVRALQAGAQFPAASFIDLYVDITVPKSILGTPLAFHNEGALRLEATLPSWPPLGVEYASTPMLGVDNDGDGLIDEDTADEDGDVYIDEDRPGPDPMTPGLPQECGNDADCDGADGEDPPAEGCGALCDDDGDGQADEDPDCLPLFNEGNTTLPLGVCMTELGVDVAPGLPSFSVGPGGPARRHPADILGLAPVGDDLGVQAPFLQIACSSLGLTGTGCDDGSDGTQDDIDGLSFGNDLAGAGTDSVTFSVGPGAMGASGTAVNGQFNCPPSSPGLAPEPDGDIFGSGLDGENSLLFDGNGPIGACEAGFPLGLVEAATRRDNLDALSSQGGQAVDSDGDGLPEAAVYFSLASGSPTLSLLGLGAGDILISQLGGPPRVYASAAQLGLGPDEDLDGFCLKDDGNGVYSGADLVYYSIAPRLTGPALPAGPGDILAPGTPPRVVRTSGQLGLAAGDDVDALECQMISASTVANGDVTCDGITNAIDALFVLQFGAALLPALPCPEHADVSRDGQTNSLDAALILQIAAGLLDRPQ